MPSNRFELLSRVKTVEREHTAVRFSTDYLLNVARHDPTVLYPNLRVRDLEESIERVEGT